VVLPRIANPSVAAATCWHAKCTAPREAYKPFSDTSARLRLHNNSPRQLLHMSLGEVERWCTAALQTVTLASWAPKDALEQSAD
jgi:hypothetical protein